MSSVRINKEAFLAESNLILKEYFNAEEMEQLNLNFNKALDEIFTQNPFLKLEDYHNEIIEKFEIACLDRMFKATLERKSDFIKLGLSYLQHSAMEGEFKKQVNYFFDALDLLINNKSHQESIKKLFDDFAKKMEVKSILVETDHFYENFFGLIMPKDFEKKFSACLAKHVVAQPSSPKAVLFRSATDNNLNLEQTMKQEEKPLYCRIQ